MIIRRPKSDDERKLFLFSLGHEFCHPEKYFKQRVLKNRFIVHFIVKGSCYYNKQRLSAGDAFLLWPNKAHSLMCVKDDPMEMFWVDLTGTHLEEYITQVGFSLDKPIFKWMRNMAESVIIQSVCPNYEIPEWEKDMFFTFIAETDFMDSKNYSPVLFCDAWWLAKAAGLLP